MMAAGHLPGLLTRIGLRVILRDAAAEKMTVRRSDEQQSTGPQENAAWTETCTNARVLMAEIANRNSFLRKLPVLFFILVVLTGIRPGYTAEQGIEQLREAALQGDTTAQFNLGHQYYNGEGVPQDYREAVKWFRMAAEQGHAKAQSGLGFMYHNGKGVPQDYREAVKWFRMAAEQGLDGAQFTLGAMYATGEGVPEDYVMAYAWANLSAAKGTKEAKDVKDLLRPKMTAEQVAEAQKLSIELLRRIESLKSQGQ